MSFLQIFKSNTTSTPSANVIDASSIPLVDITPKQRGLNNRSETRRFDMPEGVQTLSDLLEKHSGRTQFDYVVARPTASTNKKGFMRNLKSRLGHDISNTHAITNIPSIVLATNHVEFNLSAALKGYIKYSRDTNPWINIGEIYIVFFGAGSILYEQSDIEFVLYDARVASPAVSCKGRCNSSGSSAFYFSCNYSVYKDDIEHISLMVSNNNNIFKEGMSWGSMRIELAVRTSPDATSYSLNQTLGVTMADTSVLKKLRVNPTEAVVTWGETERQQLTEIHKKGQLAVLKSADGRAEGEVDVGTEASFTPEEIKERFGYKSDSYVEPMQLSTNRVEMAPPIAGPSTPRKSALKYPKEKFPSPIASVEEDKYSEVSESVLVDHTQGPLLLAQGESQGLPEGAEDLLNRTLDIDMPLY